MNRLAWAVLGLIVYCFVSYAAADILVTQEAATINGDFVKIVNALEGH